MDDYFLKYKEAKIALSMMIGQFYNVPFSKELANKIGLEYDQEVDSKNIEIIYHMFQPEAEYAWKELKLEKPIISYQELYNNCSQIEDEKFNENINYHEEYLRITIAVIEMVRKYYNIKITKKDADERKVKYSILDEIDEEVSICDHYFESAGEHAWKLVGIEDEAVGDSKFYEIEKKLRDELLELTYNKEKQKTLRGVIK